MDYNNSGSIDKEETKKFWYENDIIIKKKFFQIFQANVL